VLAKLKDAVGKSIRRASYEIRRTERPTKLVFGGIPGWFTTDEAEALYLLAATARGRILEVGHFLGRSTSAICEGIRDAGRPAEFNSYDLGFRSAEEFAEHYRTLYDRPEFAVPSEYTEMVYARGMTTSEVAREHLTRFGLAGYVNLVTGDFSALDHTRYDLIFCDAVHDPVEVLANVPAVARCSEDGCVWAFHDMTRVNLAAVAEVAPTARLLTLADTLGVFRFTRPADE
jgi:predicted O-methyltransferase YrrM